METIPNIGITNTDMLVKHNAHVLLQLRFMHWLSIRYKSPLSQLHYYTLYQLELDPNWKPEHMIDKESEHERIR